MSFDLFILCPNLDRGVAERFNQSSPAGLPDGLSIDPTQCTADSTCWLIMEDGEEWGELYIDRNRSIDDPNHPQEITPGWVELHFPSRGDPVVFDVAAALAEAAQGWVFDPQSAAAEVDFPFGDDAASLHARHGYYTPAVTRQIGDLLATKFQWD